jgi:MFS transporter, DHA3 family, macrolide efflux protein
MYLMLKINKNLANLLCGQLISQLGDGFYNIAISFWVLKATGSPAMMGMILFVQMMSSVVIGLFAGVVVDSVNRKYIIVFADLIRGIVISILAVLFYLNVFNIGFLIIIEILLGISAAFFNTAVPTLIPEIVKENELSTANSKCQLISGGALIAGPILGGIAVASCGYGFAFVVNAASFILSGFFESFINLPYILKSSDNVRENIQEKLISGYKYIYRSRQISVILIIVAIVHLFYGSILVIMPVIASKLSGNGAEQLGYFQASLGVGTVFVALILSIVKVNKNEDRLLFLGITGIGLTFCLISIVGLSNTYLTTVFLVILFAGLSSIIAVTGLSFRLLIQKNVDNDMGGRVFGVVTTIGGGSIPVAMLISGFLIDYFSPYYVLAVCGILIFIFVPILAYLYYFQKKCDDRVICQ